MKQIKYVGRRPRESLTAAKNPGVKPWNIILTYQLRYAKKPNYIVIVRFISDKSTFMADAMDKMAGK